MRQKDEELHRGSESLQMLLLLQQQQHKGPGGHFVPTNTDAIFEFNSNAQPHHHQLLADVSFRFI